MLSSGNERQQKLGIHILDYLNREIAFMDKKESHNASSDTIESTFGVTKARKSNDKLAGVTPIILMMPLRHYFAVNPDELISISKNVWRKAGIVVLKNGQMSTFLRI